MHCFIRHTSLSLSFQLKGHAIGTLEGMRLMWRPLAMRFWLKSSSAALVMPVLSWRTWPIRERVVLDLSPLRFVIVMKKSKKVIRSFVISGASFSIIIHVYIYEMGLTESWLWCSPFTQLNDVKLQRNVSLSFISSLSCFYLFVLSLSPRLNFRP